MRWIVRACAFLAVSFVLPSISLAQPGFSASSNPREIGPGSVSLFRFVIDNSGGGPTTDVAFTDVLPAGVTIVDVAPTNDCDAW